MLSLAVFQLLLLFNMRQNGASVAAAAGAVAGCGPSITRSADESARLLLFLDGNGFPRDGKEVDAYCR